MKLHTHSMDLLLPGYSPRNVKTDSRHNLAHMDPDSGFNTDDTLARASTKLLESKDLNAMGGSRDDVLDITIPVPPTLRGRRHTVFATHHSAPSRALSPLREAREHPGFGNGPVLSEMCLLRPPSPKTSIGYGHDVSRCTTPRRRSLYVSDYNDGDSYARRLSVLGKTINHTCDRKTKLNRSRYSCPFSTQGGLRSYLCGVPARSWCNPLNTRSRNDDWHVQR